MSLDLDPSMIWRDFVLDGNSATGRHDPRKAEIRRLLSAIRQSVIALLAEADPGLALPNLLIRATDAGEGTPNAIQATTNLPVPGDDAASLVALNVFEANTASPVTVSFNGGAALTIKTNSGNDVADGGLAAGMVVVGYKVGSTFRIVTDQVSSAIVIQAEAALADLLQRYLGSFADNATATASAGTPAEGQLYWNATEKEMRAWDGAIWQPFGGSVADGSVSTPKLDPLLTQIVLQNPLNALTIPGIVADDDADNTATLVDFLTNTLGSTWKGTIKVPDGVRFDLQAVTAALPDNARLDYTIVFQLGSGYRQIYHGWTDNPPDAATDTTLMLGGGHYIGLTYNNMNLAGTLSGEIGLAGPGYARGMFRTGAKGPRYFLQENYVRAPVREAEYGGRGILCMISRMRAPFRATGYESLVPGMAITSGAFYFNDANGAFYQASGSGNLGATIPNHTSGSASYNGVPFSFDNIWQSFFPIRYGDEMGRGGNTPCDTNVSFYQRQNPEDGEQFYAKWEASGASKSVTMALLSRNSAGDLLPTAFVASAIGDLNFQTGGSTRARVNQNGNFVPGSDNNYGLGVSGARWYDVWSANGTIQTSDAREKSQPRELTPAELACAKVLAKEIGMWRWLRDVDAWGDEAVTNCGVTAQRVIEVFDQHGLDPFAYSIVRWDAWEAQPAEYDARGNEVAAALPAGDRYSLKPDGFFMFIAAGFEARLAKLENQI